MMHLKSYVREQLITYSLKGINALCALLIYAFKWMGFIKTHWLQYLWYFLKDIPISIYDVSFTIIIFCHVILVFMLIRKFVWDCNIRLYLYKFLLNSYFSLLNFDMFQIAWNCWVILSFQNIWMLSVIKHCLYMNCVLITPSMEYCERHLLWYKLKRSLQTIAVLY